MCSSDLTGWVGTECVVVFIGRVWTEQAMETRHGVPHNGGNGPPTLETGVLLIGRGVAYRKTDETDLCWSATVETGSCSAGGVWRTAKRDSTGYCSSPPSTSSSLRGLLIIDRRPPPASTGSCSSSLHHALLHRLLFNHPSTGTPPPSTVHPALHHTTGSCSSRGNATAHCSSNPPCNAHCSSNRSASVSSSSEGIAPSVQLIAIVRSLGFSNA